MVEKDEFLVLLEEWKNVCELVCTGRNPPKELVEIADLVTEMKPVKHYFDQKVPAREGIEF